MEAPVSATRAVFITVELVSPVSPDYLRAFADAIRVAIAPISKGFRLSNGGRCSTRNTDMFAHYHYKLAHMYEKQNLINQVVEEYRLAVAPPSKYIAYRWKVCFGSYDLNLSELRVRELLSAVKVCQLRSIKMKIHGLPLTFRSPSKPKRTSPVCQCTELSCEHRPGVPLEEQLGLWKLQDHAEAMRRSRTWYRPWRKPSGLRVSRRK
jgi:hypothetical protein